MRACDYPPCHEPAVRQYGYHVDPEKGLDPSAWLCAEHGEILHEQRWDEDPDFRRWALPMLGMGGLG